MLRRGQLPCEWSLVATLRGSPAAVGACVPLVLLFEWGPFAFFRVLIGSDQSDARCLRQPLMHNTASSWQVSRPFVLPRVTGIQYENILEQCIASLLIYSSICTWKIVFIGLFHLSLLLADAFSVAAAAYSGWTAVENWPGMSDYHLACYCIELHDSGNETARGKTEGIPCKHCPQYGVSMESEHRGIDANDRHECAMTGGKEVLSNVEAISRGLACVRPFRL